MASRRCELVDQLTPDIVLLDVRMPGIDGLEVARHLAALPEPPAVIFTTALRRIRAAGASSPRPWPIY